jgi:hypothetical protein
MIVADANLLINFVCATPFSEDKQILRACPDIARSMRQFLSPPESPMVVREKAATYKTRRAGKRDSP